MTWSDVAPMSEPHGSVLGHISHQGKIRYEDVPGSIGVLEVLDKFMPIGEAHA